MIVPSAEADRGRRASPRSDQHRDVVDEGSAISANRHSQLSLVTEINGSAASQSHKTYQCPGLT